MEFGQRLARARKAKSTTQQALADASGIHVTQIRRYEGGKSQPTADVVRRLALGLSVSADVLLFDEDERGPSDDFKLLFEAVARLDDDERRTLREVIEGMLIKHEAKRWSSTAAA